MFAGCVRVQRPHGCFLMWGRVPYLHCMTLQQHALLATAVCPNWPKVAGVQGDVCWFGVSTGRCRLECRLHPSHSQWRADKLCCADGSGGATVHCLLMQPCPVGQRQVCHAACSAHGLLILRCAPRQHTCMFLVSGAPLQHPYPSGAGDSRVVGGCCCAPATASVLQCLLLLPHGCGCTHTTRWLLQARAAAGWLVQGM
jgi:hypothetical protein